MSDSILYDNGHAVFATSNVCLFLGEIGGLYTSAIQAQLPRLLLAAAPPGSNGQENRRECLKVLHIISVFLVAFIKLFAAFLSLYFIFVNFVSDS